MAWFHLQMYIRKYKFLAPAVCFILFLFINYSVAPNPIRSSFGSTMILNFLMVPWFTLSFLRSQSNSHQVINSLHMKSKTKFLISSYISLLLLSILLSLTAVLYPLLIGAFDLAPSVGVILFALFSHFVISFLAATIALLFSKIVMRNPGTSWPGLILVLALLLAVASAERDSLFYFLNYILPPVSMLISTVNEGVFSTTKMTAVYLLSIFYLLILMAISISIFKKKDML